MGENKDRDVDGLGQHLDIGAEAVTPAPAIGMKTAVGTDQFRLIPVDDLEALLDTPELVAPNHLQGIQDLTGLVAPSHLQGRHPLLRRDVEVFTNESAEALRPIPIKICQRQGGAYREGLIAKYRLVRRFEYALELVDPGH